MKAVVKKVTKQRGKIYGRPEDSHRNIGLAWAGMIGQHFDINMPPLPSHLVAQMFVVFKMVRATRVYRRDNYIDAEAYLHFAEQLQPRKRKK